MYGIGYGGVNVDSGAQLWSSHILAVAFSGMAKKIEADVGYGYQCAFVGGDVVAVGGAHF